MSGYISPVWQHLEGQAWAWVHDIAQNIELGWFLESLQLPS